MPTAEVREAPLNRVPDGSVGDVVHIGPETLAGRYLRNFWQPLYHSADIAPGAAKPLRILGEVFTLYRGAGNSVHLLERSCPHRGMQLSAGTVEGDALRCFYHGWKFGGDGHCLEQPAEESRFADKIKARAYPARDYLGFVFAYLGEGEPPDFPRYAEFEQFDGLLEIDSYERECNYFQNIDNALDQSHLGFVHGAGVQSIFGPVLGRQLKAEESDWGITYTFTRSDGGVFVSQFGMPNMLHLAALPTDPEIGWQESLFWWIPIDDLSHMQFSLHRVPVTGETAHRIHERRQARRSTVDLAHQAVAEEILSGRMTLAEVDRERCDMVRLEDDVSQIGQGRIADRDSEHTGSADIGLALVRRLWHRELSAFAAGVPRKRWHRRPGMRPSVSGLGNGATWGGDAQAGARPTEPQVIDVRPYVEIAVQMRLLGDGRVEPAGLASRPRPRLP